MFEDNIVTMMAIGDTGTGKSENGNAILQLKNAFEANSSPDSCTYETCAKSSTINGITRYYIDTQGLNSTDGLDASYIQQMIEFLKNWKHGINGFFILINIQNPRFDSSIQKMLMLMNDFFNNPNFWNQTGIIFTRCFKGHFNRQIAENQFRQRVITYIKSLTGCGEINPQIPCFFVDSVEWETDQSTKDEYVRIFEFAHRNSPVPTINMKLTNPDYKSKTVEYMDKVLIKIENEESFLVKKKIFYYENQKREKITYWNDEVSYSKTETIKSWTEEEEELSPNFYMMMAVATASIGGAFASGH